MLLLVHAQVGFLDWSVLAGLVAMYGVCVLALLAFGRSRSRVWPVAFIERISDSLRRLTGMPGWAMAGVLSGLFVLLVAVIGLYWDVAWHIELGRDTTLFTPPHVMILVGLGGLVYAAVVAIVFATVDGADVGPRALRPLRVPWSCLPLVAMGIGGIAAFPVDALWHQAYGLDVTLWSPSHLQLIGGGALATLAIWVMVAEARPKSNPTAVGRFIHVVVAGSALVAMTTVQGEFDFGVPQFQLLFLPLLVAAAGALILVPARIALGPWGAAKAVAVYLALRLLTGSVVTGVGLSAPAAALYVGAAASVEVVALALGTERRPRFALAAGLCVGTIGLAPELAWFHWLGWPLPGSLLLPIAVLCPLVAAAAAVLGAVFAGGFSRGAVRVRAGLVLAAGAVLVAVLAYPLPRNAGQVAAMITLDRSSAGMASVEVRLSPPDAAAGATLFGVASWQGGGVSRAGFDQTGPGTYRSTMAIPVGDPWKTVVTLDRGGEVMAAAVALPSDPSIGAAAVPAVAVRSAPFVRNTDLLLRETHDGPVGVRVLALASVFGFLTVWLTLLGVAVIRPQAAPSPTGAAPTKSTGRQRTPQPAPTWPEPANPHR